jgi:hypothetical protein
MEQAIEDRGGQHVVAKHGAPLRKAGLALHERQVEGVIAGGLKRRPTVRVPSLATASHREPGAVSPQ